MALSLTDNYKTAVGTAFQESWLFELRNDTYTNGSVDTQYIRLGTEEVGSDDTKYNSFIINKPSIRESIDLEKGTSKTGNITITCTNGTLSNHSAKLAAEIFNGTRFYMNHQVVVYSKVGSIGSGDYLKVFTGRVKDIKLNDKQEVTISIASATPIDFIKIPQYQSNSGNYYPIIYGDYKNAATSTDDVPALIDTDVAVKVYPLEVDTINGGKYNCLTHKALTNEFLHYPVKDAFRNLDDYPIFAPIEQLLYSGSLLNEALTTSETGINVDDGTDFSSGNIIQVDKEKMKVTGITSNTLTVTRAYLGTSATTHTEDSAVYIITNNVTSINTYETVSADTDRNVMQSELNLLREYIYRPKTLSTSEIIDSNNLHADPFLLEELKPLSNAVDTSTTSFFQIEHRITSAVGNEDKDATDLYTIKFTPTKEEHKTTAYSLTINYDVASYSNGFDGTDSQSVYEVTARCIATFDTDVTPEGESDDAKDANGSYTKTFNFLTNYSKSDGNAPASFEIGLLFNSINMYNAESSSMTVKIKDIQITSKAEITPEGTADTDSNSLEHQSAVTGIKELYCGGDGLAKSFSSGTVTNMVDMHRDILSRFTGRGGSSEEPSTNTSDYAGLVTARSDWKCEYWTTKEVEVDRLLQKCQFEGGFVFRFRTSDESPQYIYIPNTISADHTIGLSDIGSFSLGITPIDKLITKRIIKYQRNPINDKHLFEQTSEDTSNSVRSNYNILTKENIKTNKLDILIGGLGATNTGSGNRNDGFANYYRNINGVPKLIATIELLDPASSGGSNYFYGMEVGDFCVFDSTVSAVLPMFGGTFTNSKFIATSITRTAGSLKVTLREV
tara:strand:+ start:5203 stop:7731 length:2529 start_codon:yes stop_codon:yes gene_type:complete